LIRLRELREEKGLTQEEFGVLMGLAKSTISQYENGTREPNITNLNKFAEFFGVSIDYLLGRTEVRNPYIPSEYLGKINKKSSQLNQP
jgi:transcriptional regulator with XRE-family HTH domain